MLDDLSLWKKRNIETGDLVKILSSYTTTIDGKRFHEILTGPELTWGFENSYFVSEGSTGFFVGVEEKDGFLWAKVIFSPGLGYVDTNVLRKVL